MNSFEKDKARQLAREWWNSDHACGRTVGICDICNIDIKRDGGYLCLPHQVFDRSPDLLCETCYNRLTPEPWNESKHNKEAIELLASKIYKELNKKKKWWEIWK